MIKKPKRNLNFSVSVMTVAIAFSLVLFACSQPNNNLSDEQNNAAGEVFSEAEVMPEYPGGMVALATFLGENIVYPEAAKSNSTEGKVIVSFVIDKDGSVTDVNTANGIGNGCDEEAVRVVNLMPDWTPGYIKGEAVKVSFKLPVMFTLDNFTQKDSVYKVVEFMPEFPGGVQALMQYLGSNIKYPEQAKKDSVQGRVFISFVIEKDGQVSNAEVLRGIGGGCDLESLRVVNSMPKWSPGKDENGNPVRVAYNLPVKFKLN